MGLQEAATEIQAKLTALGELGAQVRKIITDWNASREEDRGEMRDLLDEAIAEAEQLMEDLDAAIQSYRSGEE